VRARACCGWRSSRGQVIARRLANESRHFEQQAGEHDLSAFFALRTMDEVMVANFLTFADLLEQEHYDLVIGDEAWEGPLEPRGAEEGLKA
jgi:hypothetical protein